MNNFDTSNLPIYCIGDSHSSFFAGINEIQRVWPRKAKNILPFFKVFPVGQALAYNLSKFNTTTKGREKLFKILKHEIPTGSYVTLCFGEIDCRAHLIKQSELQKRNIKSIVSESVENYFSAILDVRKLGYKVLVWNVVPSTRFEKVNNNIYPVVGTCKERNIVTSLFNKLLSEKCNKNNISFISIYKYLVDSRGLTNTSYYMDGIHLSQKAMPIALKAIADETKLNLKLSLSHLLRYKVVNLYWNLCTVSKKSKKYILNMGNI